MPDKELIKQEIERIEQILDDFNKTHNNTIDNGIVTAKKNICKHIKSFIDSLPEEPVNEGLEEEIEKYIKDSLAIKFPTTDKEQIKDDIRYIAHHFAEWQKQKDLEDLLKSDTSKFKECYEKGRFDMREEMMKDAADSKITTDGNSIFPIIKYQLPLTYDCKIGDKVRIIIVKTEQQ